MNLKDELKKLVRGDVADDAATLSTYSRDTSIFEKKPAVVVFPKDKEDVVAVVRFAALARARGENISVTPRAAGTDMTGGPLSSSIVLSFTKYMNQVEVGENEAVTEPGTFYRDFEKATKAKGGYILPSYPASREIAALGGIIGNNAGGELSLSYGKTDRYVKELEVVLGDGSLTTFRALTKPELEEKKKLRTLEGSIYRGIHELIEKNRDALAAARPKVSKNSAGYALWDVERDDGTFDLTKLIVGSQGTLAIVTSARLSLMRPKPERAMLVVFLSDLTILPDIVHRLLRLSPESFESYDDHTFRLAVRFLPQILGQMGLLESIRLGFAFLPEIGMVLGSGVPKLVLLAEFAEHSDGEALRKAEEAKRALADLGVAMRIAKDERAAEKYWKVRRESFTLLRKNLRGLYASPFIDDFVVDPDTYPRFLPELISLLEKSGILYTIAGHVGNGNFHIIPLMDLSRPEDRRIILELTPKVYELVIRYGGTTTGEHNDGIIRTPYLKMKFGEKMTELFGETKHLFDPLNVLNPGKKVGGTFEDIERFMIRRP